MAGLLDFFSGASNSDPFNTRASKEFRLRRQAREEQQLKEQVRQFTVLRKQNEVKRQQERADLDFKKSKQLLNVLGNLKMYSARTGYEAYQAFSGMYNKYSKGTEGVAQAPPLTFEQFQAETETIEDVSKKLDRLSQAVGKPASKGGMSRRQYVLETQRLVGEKAGESASRLAVQQLKSSEPVPLGREERLVSPEGEVLAEAEPAEAKTLEAYISQQLSAGSISPEDATQYMQRLGAVSPQVQAAKIKAKVQITKTEMNNTNELALANLEQAMQQKVSGLEQLKVVNATGKVFRQDPRIRDWHVVKVGVAGMERLLKQAPTADNLLGIDQGLIVLFNKVLDPKSVVRQSEYARTPEGVKVVNRIRGAVKKWTLTGGAAFTDEDRTALVDAVKQISKVYEKEAGEVIGAFKKRISRTNIRPGDVDPDLQETKTNYDFLWK